MIESELLRILARDEDIHHPFKHDANNADGLSEPACCERRTH